MNLFKFNEFTIQMKLIVIVTLIFLISSCEYLRVLNYKANTIQNEKHLRLVVSNYLYNNPSSIEAYFVDLMVNDRLYKDELENLNGAAVIFFNQSNIFLNKYLQEKDDEILRLSLEAINKAIEIDSQNAFNYFLKSFILFNMAGEDEASKIFMEGLRKPKMSNYQQEGCYYFVLFLKKGGILQPNNAFMMIPSIVKLNINADVYLFIANGLLTYIYDRDTENNVKKRAADILCDLTSENKKVFNFIDDPQRYYFKYVINKNYKGSDGLFSCIDDLELMTSDPSHNYMEIKRIVNEFRSKKKPSILEESEFWITVENWIE